MTSNKILIEIYNKICLNNDMLSDYISENDIISDIDIDYISYTIKYYLNFFEKGIVL